MKRKNMALLVRMHCADNAYCLRTEIACKILKRSNVVMSSSAARSADRGGAAGGGVRQESTLQLHKLFCFQTCGKAALRLTVNPFGSQARHFPYLPRKQGKTLLRFRLLIMIHSYIAHRAIAYIALTRRHRGRHSPAAVCG